MNCLRNLTLWYTINLGVLRRNILINNTHSYQSWTFQTVHCTWTKTILEMSGVSGKSPPPLQEHPKTRGLVCIHSKDWCGSRLDLHPETTNCESSSIQYPINYNSLTSWVNMFALWDKSYSRKCLELPVIVLGHVSSVLTMLSKNTTLMYTHGRREPNHDTQCSQTHTCQVYRFWW